MKTRASIFSFFLFIAFNCFSQIQSFTLADFGLKGKVKSVNETTYLGVLKFGDLTKGTKSSSSEEKFNKEGFATKRDFIYFDEKGKKEDGFKQSFTFDKKNHLVEMEDEDEEEDEIQHYKLTNNSLGKPEVMDVLSKKGKLLQRHKFKYNNNGKVTEHTTYNSNGDLVEKSVTTYSQDGLKQERITYDEKEKMKEKDISLFDNRGNIIESANYEYKNGKVEEYIRQYKFDLNNNIIEERNSISGLNKKEVYLYDDKQNLVKHVDEYGSVYVYTYTYDSNGNWIKKVADIKDKFLGNKMEISERTISYY